MAIIYFMEVLCMESEDHSASCPHNLEVQWMTRLLTIRHAGHDAFSEVSLTEVLLHLDSTIYYVPVKLY